MTDNSVLPGLGPALGAASAWLAEQRVPYAVIGGVAASLLGQPRTTRDIDILADAPEGTWSGLVSKAGKHSITPRVEEVVDFAARSRVLLLSHEPTKTPLDVVCAQLPFELEVIKAAEVCQVGGTHVRLLRPEDLIIMKAVAQRPRDLADIEGIAAAQTGLDWDYVENMGGQFAAALDASVIEDTLKRVRERHEH